MSLDEKTAAVCHLREANGNSPSGSEASHGPERRNVIWIVDLVA